MSHTLKAQLNKTWGSAFRSRAVYLTPSIWFIGGLFKDDIVGQIESLTTGLLFIGMAYMFTKSIHIEYNLKTKMIDEMADMHEGIGMMKALTHFKNGGDLDGLVAKIRSKSPIEKLNNK